MTSCSSCSSWRWWASRCRWCCLSTSRAAWRSRCARSSGPWTASRAATSTQRALVVSTDEIGAVAEGFNRMVQGLREREQIKETFGRYVSREIRDEILAGRVALGGQTLRRHHPLLRPARLHPVGGGDPGGRRGAGPELVLLGDGSRHPEPPRPGLTVHRRRDRGRVRRAGAHERPSDHGRARRPRDAPAPGRVERRAAARPGSPSSATGSASTAASSSPAISAARSGSRTRWWATP